MVITSWEPDIPSSLTMEQANAIMLLKKQCTWRRLAIEFLGEEDQISGSWLARDAACRLTGLTLYDLYNLEFDLNTEFSQAHKSGFGDFFWWE